MAGGSAQSRFHGHQTVAPADAVEAWTRTAAKGDSFVYCSAIELIRGETSAKVRELVQRGLVTSHQRRRAGGGWEFFVLRTSLVPKEAPRQRDHAADTILSALKRAANLGLACPSDVELARVAGLSTRDQAQWRVRKLVDEGVIQSTVAHENGVPTRVVTIVATGKRTALPPKWAALERATLRGAGTAAAPSYPRGRGGAL